MLALCFLSLPLQAQPQTSTQRDPDGAKSRAASAMALLESGEQDGAEAGFLEALELDSECPLALHGYGSLLYQQGDFAGAAYHFQMLVEVAPDEVAGWYNLGYALRKSHEYEEAVKAYRKYIAANPDDPDGYFGLAETLRALGWFDEALVEYQNYLEKEERESEVEWVERAQERVADLQFKIEKKREAEELAQQQREAQQRKENEARAAQQRMAPQPPVESEAPVQSTALTADERADELVRQGDTLFRSRDHQGALARYEQALSLTPNESKILLKVGLAQANLGRQEQALNSWRQVLALDPGNKHASAYIARVESAQASTASPSAPASPRSPQSPAGQPENSATEQGLAGRQASNSAQHADSALQVQEAYQQATQLISSRKFGEALDVLNGILRQNPKHLSSLSARASLNFALRDYQAATSDYRQVLTLQPSLAAPLYGLGRAYEALGDETRAAQFYDAYLKSNASDVQPQHRANAESRLRALGGG